MNSEDAQKLGAYADGELSPEEYAEVDAWLARDEAARAKLKAMQSLREELQSDSGPVTDVDSAWKSFQSARYLGRGSDSDNVARLRPILAAAAVLIFTFVLWRAFLPEERAQEEFFTDSSHRIEWVETEFEEANQVVYIDEDSGWAIVWVEEVPTG